MVIVPACLLAASHQRAGISARPLLIPLDVEDLIVIAQPAFAVFDEANPVNS